MTSAASESKASATDRDKSQASSEQTVVYETPPSVVVVKSKKKKGKKYSKQLRPLQELEIAVSKGNQRIAKAVHKGLVTWNKNRDLSSKKSRDGAIKDGLKNANKSLREVAVAGVKAQADVLDSVVDMKSTKILTKSAVRLLSG